MAKPRSVTDEERARIVDSLRGGKMSQAKIAKEFGRGVATISRIANSEGIDTERSATEKATKTRQRYDQAERREVLNAGFEKAKTLLDNIADAGEFQKWTVGIGTLVDKVRLEEGEATERGEHTHNRGSGLASELRDLDAELADLAADESPPAPPQTFPHEGEI